MMAVAVDNRQRQQNLFTSPVRRTDKTQYKMQTHERTNRKMDEEREMPKKTKHKKAHRRGEDGGKAITNKMHTENHCCRELRGAHRNA